MAAPRTIKISSHGRRIQVDAWPTGTPGLMVAVASYAIAHTATGKALPAGIWRSREGASAWAAMARSVCDWTLHRPAVVACPQCAGEQLTAIGCRVCRGLGLVSTGPAASPITVPTPAAETPAVLTGQGILDLAGGQY